MAAPRERAPLTRLRTAPSQAEPVRWLCAPCHVLYGAALYFRAATASLTDQYQPGIGALRFAVQPGWLLLVLLCATLLARKPFWPRLTSCVAGGALMLCALLLLWMTLGTPDTTASSTWQPLAARELASTLKIALFSPWFSNRSIGTTLGSALWATAVLAISWKISTRSRLSSTPTSLPD
ncbi:MAG: hypothetical protein Q4G71_12625 [Pseudomonadota bacterium]|nr:hypothetical protein [Pseudomonadota bacterium]